MVLSIEELTNVAGFVRELERAFTLEKVVLKVTLVPADAVVVTPREHPLTMHSLILKVPHIPPAIWPLEHAIMMDLVVQERTCVDTSILPSLRPLPSGAS